MSNEKNVNVVNGCALKLAAIECTKEFVSFAGMYGNAMNASKTLGKYVVGKTIANIENEDTYAKLKSRKDDLMQIAVGKLFILDKAFFKKEHQHIITTFVDNNDYEALMDEVERAICGVA